MDGLRLEAVRPVFKEVASGLSYSTKPGSPGTPVSKKADLPMLEISTHRLWLGGLTSKY